MYFGRAIKEVLHAVTFSSGKRCYADPRSTASELDASKLGFTMMPMTKGIIEGVNWQAKEITLSHERIYDINLAPETTTFKVRDIKTLRAFHPGDSVYFIADRIKGAPIVIKLLERHPE